MGKGTINMGGRKRGIIVPKLNQKIEDLQPVVRKTIRDSVEML